MYDNISYNMLSTQLIMHYFALLIIDKNQTTVKQGCGDCKLVKILAGVFGPLLFLLIIAAVILIICCSRKNVKESFDGLKSTILKGNTDVIDEFNDFKGKVLAALKSAGGNPPAQNDGTKEDNIEDDYGTGMELSDFKTQKERGALISFVSDSLSAALENPKISDEVKENIDSIIKKHWQDITHTAM